MIQKLFLIFLPLCLWATCANATSGTIPSTGGFVEIVGVAKVVFPSGAFSNSTVVELSQTTDSETAVDFTSTAPISGVIDRVSYEVRVISPVVPTQGQLTLRVPDTFIAQLTDLSELKVMGQILHNSASEATYPFESINISSVDMVNKTVQVSFYAKEFTELFRDDDLYEAVFTIGRTEPAYFGLKEVIQGVGSSQSARAQFTDDNEPISIFEMCYSPVIGNPFGVTAPTPLVSDHYSLVDRHFGTDYPGQEYVTGLYAVASGKVEAIGWNYRETKERHRHKLKKVGFGRFLVIKHWNGSRTLYGHMPIFGYYVTLNQEVVLGDPIGLVGNTGGSTNPHLHLEYVPQVAPSWNAGLKVNAHPCVNLNTAYSITVFDAGPQKDDSATVYIDGVQRATMTSGATNRVIIPTSVLSPGNHNLCVACNNSSTANPLNRCTIGTAIGEGFQTKGAFYADYNSSTGGGGLGCLQFVVGN